MWTGVESYGDGACGGVGCTVPQSARTHSQAHRDTLPPPWACTICCAEPIHHGANQHVDGGGGDVVQLCETSASTTDNARRVGFIEDEAVLIPLLELELGNAISKQYGEALTELTSFGMSIIAPSFSKMASVTINLLSADDLELAERWLRYDNDKSPRLQKKLWAFVECLYCGCRCGDSQSLRLMSDVCVLC